MRGGRSEIWKHLPLGAGAVFLLAALSCPACFQFNPEDLEGFDAATDEVVAPDGFDVDVDGDGFELGEPSDDGGTEPDPDAAVECEGDSECDDDNDCTVDACVSSRCVYAAADDGESCPSGLCCGGQCGECCADLDCNDDNPCTDDRCSARSCQRTNLPDMTVCDGSICCSGQPFPDGECCSEEDCDDGCVGTATACSDIDESACEAQRGCALVTGCWGDPDPCSSYPVREACEACGCVFYSAACHGDTPPACETYLTSGDCSSCGCAWEPSCTGAHPPCAAYSDRAECNSQDGCHWSVCMDHSCT